MVGTAFEASHVPLHQWFRAICLLAAPSLRLSDSELWDALRAGGKRRTCSVSDLQEILGVARKTAWLIRGEILERLSRNRLAIPEWRQVRLPVSPGRKPASAQDRSRPTPIQMVVTPEFEEEFKLQSEPIASRKRRSKARAKKRQTGRPSAIQLGFRFDD